MSMNFKSSSEIIEHFKKKSITMFQSRFSVSLESCINLDLEEFEEFLVNENLKSIFYYVVEIDEDDFFINKNQYKGYDLHHQSFVKQIIEKYNHTLTIDESLIDLEKFIVILALYNGNKMLTIYSFPNSELLDDTEDILHNLVLSGLEDGTFDEYKNDILINKQKQLDKLDNFLKNDTSFKKAKNQTLRIKYLNELQISNPEIFELFKFTPYRNNPANYLNAMYQKFK